MRYKLFIGNVIDTEEIVGELLGALLSGRARQGFPRGEHSLGVAAHDVPFTIETKSS
jgi:hypothetical protein